MTLIAGHDKYNLPVLLGDILVSSERPTNKEPVTLPGLNNTIHSKDGLLPWLVPVDLVQKTVLLSNYLAVSWTGNELSAKVLLDHLPQHSKKFSFDEWNTFFSKIHELFTEEAKSSVGADFGCIFLVFADNLETFVPFNVDSHETEFANTLLVGGSGAEWAKHVLDGKYLGTIDSDGYAARDSLLCTLAQLWARDSLDQLNIIHGMFGGGYEAVVPGLNGLEKLSDLLLLSAQITQVSETEFDMNIFTKIAKFDYVDDVLAIRCRDYTVGKADRANRRHNLPMADADVEMFGFLVGDPSKKPIPEDLDLSRLPDMNAEMLGVHTDCFMLSGEVTGFSYSYVNSSRKSHVWFEEGFMYFEPELQQAIHDGYASLLKLTSENTENV